MALMRMHIRHGLLGVLLVAFAAVAAHAQTSVERQIMDLANQARAEQGLGPLVWNASLAAAARRHAALVARSGQLSHQYPGEPDLAARMTQAGAKFQVAAENIAQGTSADQLHQEWMNSPHHRANILDPRLDAIGVAVVQRGGILYAVQDFSLEVVNLGPQQVEAKVTSLLVARGITPIASHEVARATCQMDHGSAGGPRPMFIMRWEGSDLGRLPDQLQERLDTGKYHKAAVGACGGSQAGFSGYHVAVLLYY
jgi:hypothetical protein